MDANRRAFHYFTAISMVVSTLGSGLHDLVPLCYAADEKPEELTLTLALAKANRNNPTLYSRRLTLELQEIAYDNAWARMFLPQVNLQSMGNSAFSMGHLPGSAAASTGALDRGAASGSTQLNLGQYTIFNFGKDADLYNISKLEVERARQSIREIERQVRFDTIQAVFRFRTQQDLLDIAQRSTDSAQAIFDLIKSRVSLKRATETDMASAEVDLINAKNELISAQTAYSQAAWNLNYVLGDPINHSYRVKSAIKYIRFKMALDDILQIFKDNAPQVRDAKKFLEQAKLTEKIADKNSLPLPSVTFSGVSIGSTYGANGTAPIRNTTNGGNLDISASLNFTIPIVGDGGFLNARTRRAAELNTEIAELNLRNAANQGEVIVRGQYVQLLQTETTIENNNRLFKQSLRVFEDTLIGLQSRNAINRLDLKDAISQLRHAEQQLTDSVLNHYSLKLQLAETIGVDRFPEENL